jgi:1-acylglycerone phosphate reductase
MFLDTSKPQDYAKAVVREATKKQPKRWFWWGAKTTTVWFFNTFIGLWIWEPVMNNIFNLQKLRQQPVAQKKVV